MSYKKKRKKKNNLIDFIFKNNLINLSIISYFNIFICKLSFKINFCL